jgi:PAS domain S-box-containing protein
MEDFKASDSFNYLQTVLATADGTALFLDTDLVVRNCTPRAAKLLEIATTDYGQPLANFESVIGYSNLVSDARKVLASLESVEQRIELRPNNHYRIRILPHTNGEEETEGLVISFRRANQENIEEQTRLEQEVTQRKQAEADLRQSELTARNRLAEIEFIYNTAPVGLCVLDTEFRFVRINKRLAEINGLSVEEHLGKTVREVLPDLADEAEATLQKIVDSGEAVLGLEIRGETPAQPGVERVWLENWLPYKNQQGKVIGVNIVAEEVTEQRKMKLAAQESEERYTQLFNALDDGFCVCQMLMNEHDESYDYRFIEVNPAFETHTGLKNALGKTAYTLIPNLEKHWLETYAKVALERKPIRFEQGSAEMGRWFDVYAFPFGLPEKKKFAIQFKDITQRKQAEESIRAAKEAAEREEQKLHNLFEQAPVAIAILSGEQFVVELANSKVSELWGREQAQLLGKPIFDVLTEARDQGFEELLSDVLQSGQPFIGNELPVTLKRKEQLETVYFNFVYHPWQNESNQTDRIIVVATEVTDQVLARQAIEVKNQELEVANSDLNQAFQEQYKLTALLNNSSDFIGLATPEGVPVYVNAAGLEMVGLPEDQPLSALKLTDFFLEEDLPYVNDTIVPTVLETGIWVGEYQFCHFQTGEPIPVLYNLFTVTDPATDELLGIATITVDITERKQAEEAIKAAKEAAEREEQKLLDLFEQAPVGIAIYQGPQYTVELANPLVRKLLRRESEEILGRPLFEAVPEAKSPGFEEMLAGVLRSGKPFVAQEVPVTIRQHGHDSTQYYDAVYQPWQNAQGDTVGIIAMASEVTEQVLARQKVAASERRFRTLLNSIPQMTWTNLPDGSVNFYSNGWYDYTGLTYEQIKEWGWKPIVHPDDLDDMLRTYRRALETGQEFMYENRLKRYDGAYRWHLNRSLPLRDDSGQITLWVGTSTDIHEQKLNEEKLQEASEEMEVLNEELVSTNDELIRYNEELSKTNEQLRQVNADMDNFVYMASHDLKTPINNIEGLMNALVRLLSPDKTQSDKIRRLFDMMQTSVNRFKSTLTELAQIARLQREAAQDISLVSLQKVIAEVQLDLTMQIEEAEAQIDTDIERCPEVKFSARNLRSVVYNLLSNAIKYRSPDRLPQISIVCEETNEYQILSVTDNGLGMDTADEKKVFGMFQRLHDHVEGTGVGLYITKKIIESAGGKIKVESEVDVGTTFRVYFPH